MTLGDEDADENDGASSLFLSELLETPNEPATVQLNARAAKVASGGAVLEPDVTFEEFTPQSLTTLEQCGHIIDDRPIPAPTMKEFRAIEAEVRPRVPLRTGSVDSRSRREIVDEIKLSVWDKIPAARPCR